MKDNSLRAITRTFLVLLLLSSCLSCVTQAPDNSQKRDAQPATPPKPFIVPMDVTVPLAPTAFQADGKTHLAYELHITNFSGQSVSLSRIEVLNDSGVTISKVDSSGLIADVNAPGNRQVTGIGKLKIGSGRWSQSICG